jgi:hypothetical protein
LNHFKPSENDFGKLSRVRNSIVLIVLSAGVFRVLRQSTTQQLFKIVGYFNLGLFMNL